MNLSGKYYEIWKHDGKVIGIHFNFLYGWSITFYIWNHTFEFGMAHECKKSRVIGRGF